MEIELNEILNNSHNRNMKERIIIFDDKGDYYIFKHSNIMERVKQMKVERFEIVRNLKVMKILNYHLYMINNMLLQICLHYLI